MRKKCWVTWEKSRLHNYQQLSYITDRYLLLKGSGIVPGLSGTYLQKYYSWRLGIGYLPILQYRYPILLYTYYVYNNIMYIYLFNHKQRLNYGVRRKRECNSLFTSLLSVTILIRWHQWCQNLTCVPPFVSGDSNIDDSHVGTKVLSIQTLMAKNQVLINMQKGVQLQVAFSR